MTVPETGVPVMLEPEEAKVAPRTDYEGKFSLQYSTAAMLVHGRVGLTTYTVAALADPDVLALAARSATRRGASRRYPRRSPAATGSGRGRSHARGRVGAPTGSAENPLSEAQVRQKFRDNAALADGGVASVESAISRSRGERPRRAMARSSLAPRVAA